MKRRHKLATVLAAALIAALLIAGAAIAAANSRLLSALFPGGAPETAQLLLVRDDLSCERDGLKLTVTEHLYDGRSFHINWAVQSQRDDAVFVATEYRMTDAAGKPIDISHWSNRSSTVDQAAYALRALNVDVDGKRTTKAYEGSTSNSFLPEEAPEGPWMYTLDIYAYQTELAPVALTVSPYELTDGQIIAMEKAGRIGVGRDEIAYIDRYEAYEATYDDSDWSWSGRAKARVAANEACGLLKPASHLSVTLKMEPARLEARALRSPVEVKNRDFVLELDKLGFDLTGAYADYRLLGDFGEYDDPQLHRLFLVLDQDGCVLNGVLSEGSASYTPIYESEGGPGVEVEQGGGVPSAVPTAVRLLYGPAQAQALLERYEFGEALALWQADPSGWEESVLALQ